MGGCGGGNLSICICLSVRPTDGTRRGRPQHPAVTQPLLGGGGEEKHGGRRGADGLGVTNCPLGAVTPLSPRCHPAVTPLSVTSAV